MSVTKNNNKRRNNFIPCTNWAFEKEMRSDFIAGYFTLIQIYRFPYISKYFMYMYIHVLWIIDTNKR